MSSHLASPPALTPSQPVAGGPENAPETAPETPISGVGRAFPDPKRPFWWFSSTSLPQKRIPAGLPVECEAGYRLPAEADYWCHEGDREWTPTNRELLPKPEPVKKKKTAKPREVE